MGECWFILNETRKEFVDGGKWIEGEQAETLMQMLEKGYWKVGDKVITIGEYDVDRNDTILVFEGVEYKLYESKSAAPSSEERITELEKTVQRLSTIIQSLQVRISENSRDLKSLLD